MSKQAGDSRSAPRVLLVDDVYTARSMLNRVFTHVGGYDVEEAADTLTALDKLSAEAFDLVVTDLGLTGMAMDGKLLAERIRAAEQATGHPRLPIILYTALRIPEGDKWLSHYEVDYVHKSGNLTILIQKMRELVPQ